MTEGDEWYAGFFGGLWAEAYAANRDHDLSAAARGLERLLGLKPGERLLDVPCGDGRWARAFGAMGYAVTAVDQNRAVLADLHQFPDMDKISWIVADMRKLPWRNAFDAALCLGGSFGYFTEGDDLAFLLGVVRTLKRGGRLVCDLHVAETLFPIYQPVGRHQTGEIAIEEHRNYDPASGVIDSDWTLTRAGHVEHKTSRIRIYSSHEVVRLFRLAGLRDLELYGSAGGDAFNIGSPRLFIVGKAG